MSYMKTLIAVILNLAQMLGQALLKLCDLVGLIASVLFHYTLSADAFKRYWRWSVRAFYAIDTALHAFADWFAHVTYLNGRLGIVNFDVEAHEQDGYFVLRQFGDRRMVRLNFRVENRWLARHGRLTNRHLNELMTRALDAGYQVAHVYWGERRLVPYNVEALALLRTPDDVRLPAERRWYMEPAKSDFNPHRYMNIIHRA